MKKNSIYKFMKITMMILSISLFAASCKKSETKQGSSQEQAGVDEASESATEESSASHSQTQTPSHEQAGEPDVAGQVQAEEKAEPVAEETTRVAVSSVDGAKVYSKNGCSSCHHPDKDQLSSGLGPSLVMISAAYKNDQKGLIAFMNSGTKETARVAPAKFSTMQSQLPRLKKLSPDEQAGLAQYILSH